MLHVLQQRHRLLAVCLQSRSGARGAICERADPEEAEIAERAPRLAGAASADGYAYVIGREDQRESPRSSPAVQGRTVEQVQCQGCGRERSLVIGGASIEGAREG